MGSKIGLPFPKKDQNNLNFTLGIKIPQNFPIFLLEKYFIVPEVIVEILKVLLDRGPKWDLESNLLLPRGNKRGLKNQTLITASPTVLSMRPCTVKLYEEKSKYARLAQENSFGAASHAKIRGGFVKGTAHNK